MAFMSFSASISFWSSPMHMTSQVDCKRVVKWDAISRNRAGNWAYDSSGNAELTVGFQQRVTHRTLSQYHHRIGQNMKQKAPSWDVARTRAKLQELSVPDVIGFYRSIEITEVLRVQGKTFTNILTLAVAEPLEAPVEVDWQKIFLNEKRQRLAGTDWYVGIAQYRLSLDVFLEKLANFEASGRWSLSPVEVETGTLAAVAPQYVGADGQFRNPWNGVLKNNFFEGSHVMELFDTSKGQLKFLLDDSRRLTGLAEIVGQYIPIKLDGMSDRLGNIIIQMPVTVLSSEVRGSPEGDHCIAVEWHPDVAPRSLKVSAEIWEDSTFVGYDSATISTGQAKLRLNSPRGGARSQIWDEDKSVLLSADPPVHFITSINMSMSIAGATAAAQREFFLTDSSGTQFSESLRLISPSVPDRFIGSSPEKPREPWVSLRVFSESVSNLIARKEFVQYGRTGTPVRKATEQKSDNDDSTGVDRTAVPDVSAKGMSAKDQARMAALGDLHWLMKEHGEEGVWLWDPFLDAEAVLRTLFFCPHFGVPLRALTAGKAPPSESQRPECKDELSKAAQRQQARERAVRERREQVERLETAKGNCHGLQLEFRIREGSAGWGFHDRFIIFPRAQGGALAWSLGTSINSFGDEHHILQKVQHGEAIAQAFLDLWGKLEKQKYLIWKTPTDGESAQ